MKHTTGISAHFWCSIFCLSIASHGSPRAVVDTLEIPFDTIYEGAVNELKHTFRVTNTGDSALAIKKVRKNCGCTSYRFDSIIAPGATGAISVVVDLGDIQPGEFNKALIVNTNDPRSEVIKLSLYGVLVAHIDADAPSVVLPTVEKKDTAVTVSLSSVKSDLLVTKVRFVMDNPEVTWQSEVPISFRFEKTGARNKQGRWVYKVTLHYFPVKKECRYGSFVLSTNHPKKPEIKIAGVLDPVK